MIKKTDKEILAAYLIDTSGIRGGHAESALFPESISDVIHAVREANQTGVPLTISGSGTGTTGGRIPFGGCVLSMEKLKSISLSSPDTVVISPGTTLGELDTYLEKQGLIYPVDPTEDSAQLGATIANNSSGARTFAFGSTRNWVVGLKVVLPTGQVLELKRLQSRVNSFPQDNSSKELEHLIASSLLSANTSRMESLRKNTAGYYLRKGMDALDLFIGSEGTLGVIVEATIKVIQRPAYRFAFYIFFQDEDSALNAVTLLRSKRINNPSSFQTSMDMMPVVLEYFDSRSLNLLCSNSRMISSHAKACVYIEQWSADENTQGEVFNQWGKFADSLGSKVVDIWAATTPKELKQLQEIRHGLPIAINEMLARYGQPKVSLDFAVPEPVFSWLYSRYVELIDPTGLNWLMFGHIGDCHLHVNLLPKDASEYSQAQKLYTQLASEVISIGGTISAEHGVGKLKHALLVMMLGDKSIDHMRHIKQTLDPNDILNRNNIFSMK